MDPLIKSKLPPKLTVLGHPLPWDRHGRMRRFLLGSYPSMGMADARTAMAPAASFWGFENWDKEGKEEHHIGRKKYSDRTILIPVSMHRELTRRQVEEHPADGPDPSNPLQRQGRLFLGLADILECLADALRWIGESLIETAKHEERDLKEPVEIPEYLTQLLCLVGERLIETANHIAGDLKE